MKKKTYFVAYFTLLAICFLMYVQTDIFHTTLSSYAFLDGHILDFYDFNKRIVGGNDYLPSIYVIFAIWNIPIYLLGLVTPADLRILIFSISQLEIFWNKLLPVLFFMLAVGIIHKISVVIDSSSIKLKNNSGLIFATAPIALFSIFIFSGYDILGLVFSLLGIYYLFKKDIARFTLFFSIAISFKYFAIVIFIPLLLLREKKLINILRYGIISISVTIIELAFYWHSKIFRGQIFSLMIHKLGDPYSAMSHGSVLPFFLMIGYGLLCAYLYFKKVKDDQEFYRIAIISCIASFAFLFNAVLWHPQWLILLMPFFSLAYRYFPRPKYMAYFDILGMVSYLWVCFINWPNNVDISMVNIGIMKEFFPKAHLLGGDFIITELNIIFTKFLSIYFFSPIIVYLYQNYNKNSSLQNDLTLSLIFLRSIFGIGLFIILTILSLYLPATAVSAINPDAYLRGYLNNQINSSTGKTVNEILDDRVVTQRFEATSNGLAAVGILMANYQRKPAGLLIFELKNTAGDIVAKEKVEASKIKDNQYYILKFPSLADSKFQYYELTIRSSGAFSGASATAWVDESAASSQEVWLQLAGEHLKGGLVMSLFYDPSFKQVKQQKNLR